MTKEKSDVQTSVIDWTQLGLNSKKVRKGQILQEHGNIVTKAFYVKKGLLKSYTIDDNGKIHIFMFAPEGWIVSDIASHIYSEPTELFIDAIEDSEIVEITEAVSNIVKFDIKDFQPELKKLLRRLAVLQKRVIMLMSATARQRYEHFIETYPQLLTRVPQKMIASYLGITPEALSNIRSKIRNGDK